MATDSMGQGPSYNPDKLSAAVLHTVSSCPSDMLGATKLHKVLYFADMFAYLARREPITGSTYVKRPFGPTCRQLLPTLSQLKSEGALSISEVEFYGLKKMHYVAHIGPAHGTLSNWECGLLGEVIDWVCHQNSASSISELSHQMPWELAQPGGVIPYSSAYLLLPPDESDGDAFSGFDEDIAEIEDARASNRTLARRDFGDFRAAL